MANKGQPEKYTELTERQLTWEHYIYQWISIQLIHIYVLLNYTLKIHGQENKPKEWMPCIMACNHVSSLDPPLVSVAMNYRPISYMAKKELFETPFMRIYNQLMSSFAVNREKLEMSTIKTALKILKHGKWAVGIFPEGTRNKDGSISTPKKGVAYFAKMAKVPVLPLAMVHSRNQSGKKRIDIRIGKLVPPQDDIDALSDTIQAAIQALIEETKASLPNDWKPV